MRDFTIEQLEALKEGTTPGPWEAKDDHGGPNLFSPTGRLLSSDSCGDVSGEEEDVNLMAAALALVDALIAEKRAHQGALHLVRELWSDVYNHGNVGRASVLRHLTRILETHYD